MASRNTKEGVGAAVYCQLAITDHSACHSTIAVSNDADHLLLYAIISQQLPEALLSMLSSAISLSIKRHRQEISICTDDVQNRSVVCAEPVITKAGPSHSQSLDGTPCPGWTVELFLVTGAEITFPWQLGEIAFLAL